MSRSRRPTMPGWIVLGQPHAGNDGSAVHSYVILSAAKNLRTAWTGKLECRAVRQPFAGQDKPGDRRVGSQTCTAAHPMLRSQVGEA